MEGSVALEALEALKVPEHLNGLVIRFMAAWQKKCLEMEKRNAAKAVVKVGQDDDLIGFQSEEALKVDVEVRPLSLLISSTRGIYS